MSNLKLVFGGIGCLVLGIGAGLLQPPVARVTFLSVGQGDCAVIQAGGRTLLIDDGPTTPTFDAGERIVIPKLRALGVDRLDAIFLSHPDTDHVGGTPALLRRFPEAQVVMSAVFHGDPEMDRRLSQWHLSADRIVWIGPESMGRLGPYQLRLSCPPFRRGEDANDGSMFVRFGLPTGEVVFTGDAPEPVEEYEMKNGDWSADVLKAGHHGSKTASGLPWLRTVHPKWVIISCGRDNRYGHPHAAALDRIAQSGAKLARTDREGDITFEWRGQNLVRVTP